MRRSLVGYLCGAAMLVPCIEAASAQSVAALTARLTLDQTPSSQPAPSRITIAFEKAPIGDAIRTIARRSGTVVLFASDLLPAKRVTYRGTNVTAADALIAIVVGTGLRVNQTTDGSFELVRDPSASTQAQGIITGVITSAKTGAGISGATIVLDGGAKTVIAREGGVYRITGITPGAHTLTVRALGYTKQTRRLSVDAEATVTAAFSLDASTNQLDQVVVTGTVVPTALKAVPNAMTVVTAQQIEERGITRIDQLFRGDVPGLFSINLGSGAALDSVVIFSRGATYLGQSYPTNPIKTFVDGIELSNPRMLSQIDPKSIERMEILTGPQASTVYGSNAINGVIQIFTKRGTTTRPQITATLLAGTIQNSFTSALTPQHDDAVQISGVEGHWSYQTGLTWNYMGAWSPAKQTARTNAFGAARMQRGILTADVSLRYALTQNRANGSTLQTGLEHEATGEWCRGCSASGSWRSPLTVARSTGQAFGLTLGLTPTSWWSHELSIGTDLSDGESHKNEDGYVYASDTLLTFATSHSARTTTRYTTTANIPITSAASAVVTAGADGWRTSQSSMSVTPMSLTGTLTGTSTITRQFDHNAGLFIQSQLGLSNAVFLTYGLRAEWNPNYGEDALPNVAPRYGVAYTQSLGTVTAKLRASYGRSTRPPISSNRLAVRVTNATSLDLYGPYNSVLANPELGPEFQKGGEGGLELYFGNRGSLVITRYNQTVDDLIASISGVDSVQSLLPYQTGFNCTPSITDSYCYARQSQYLNVGSIRNEGWEFNGTAVLGMLTARGTYSWTKSRVIGITPKYRALLRGSNYAPGSSFQLLPEHTWALAITYAQAGTSMTVNLNGIGRYNKWENEISDIRYMRLDADKTLLNNPWGSVNSYPALGYTTADLNGTHRFSSIVEGVMQVQNLGNYYTNDYNARYASIGRQTKFGLRIRW